MLLHVLTTAVALLPQDQGNILPPAATIHQTDDESATFRFVIRETH